MSVTRIHQSWLAATEKRLLTATAALLPGWVTPDRLTLLGLAGALLTGVCYVGSRHSPLWLIGAIAGLGLNWFGDSLDGTLARVRKIERPVYGYFVDHSTDLISQVFIFLGLGLSPYLRFDAACLILLSYWLAALLTFIRAVATGVFQISYYGIGPTEIRIALGLYTLVVAVAGRLVLPWGGLTLIDAFGFALFPLVFALFCVMVWRESRALAARE
jgi:phosphatidylglycerophosphate synthase